MKNWLGQIAIHVQNISFYGFINPEHTRLLNGYAEVVTNALENYDLQQFEQIVTELENLITNLRTEE